MSTVRSGRQGRARGAKVFMVLLLSTSRYGPGRTAATSPRVGRGGWRGGFGLLHSQGGSDAGRAGAREDPHDLRPPRLLGRAAGGDGRGRRGSAEALRRDRAAVAGRARAGAHADRDVRAAGVCALAPRRRTLFVREPHRWPARASSQLWSSRSSASAHSASPCSASSRSSLSPLLANRSRFQRLGSG